ncbi:MAG TPA: hypothetical protein VD994_07525 [Prosthecobacter sp.]|nr:hypothetical protein [Prosthecobacter sp.]
MFRVIEAADPLPLVDGEPAEVQADCPQSVIWLKKGMPKYRQEMAILVAKAQLMESMLHPVPVIR